MAESTPTPTPGAEAPPMPELAEGTFRYRALGEGRYRSTVHAQGAWNPHEQHMAPVTGLLVHELEQFQPRDDLRLARVSFDIHGLIHAGEFEVRTRMIRPGRTIELVEAELVAGGRTAVVARGWRMLTTDSRAVAGVEDEPLDPPEALEPFAGLQVWPGGFIRSLEIRTPTRRRPGRGAAWLRSEIPLLEDVEVSPLADLASLADTANGIVPRVDPGPESWAYPNLDLQLHLHRAPAGDWLGVDVRQTFGADGVGLTSTVLHDEHGPFGRCEQILTLRAPRGTA